MDRRVKFFLGWLLGAEAFGVDALTAAWRAFSELAAAAGFDVGDLSELTATKAFVFIAFLVLVYTRDKKPAPGDNQGPGIEELALYAVRRENERRQLRERASRRPGGPPEHPDTMPGYTQDPDEYLLTRKVDQAPEDWRRHPKRETGRKVKND